jgi:hypothetical protein
MTNLLDGGKENTARRRFIRSPLDGKDFIKRASMSRTEIFADGVKEFIEVHKKFPKFKLRREDIGYMTSTVTPGGNSIANHMYIF